MRETIIQWTVDYGDGRTRKVSVPHAWRQDVDVRWEGPVIYRTTIRIPNEKAVLRFQGVSYAAKVFVEGELTGEHHGMWDAFDVPLPNRHGAEVQIEVHVNKNGGPTYPVKSVLSGFLPYVYHTFGGIFKPVELISASELSSLDRGNVSQRVSVSGSKLFVDRKPFYIRGALTWGWYESICHQNPDEATIRHEIETARRNGFNLIKFCLWMPPHRYLESMHEAGLEAWIELPLWDPVGDADQLEAMFGEMERIVRQYRHHPNIIIWTCGCELSDSTPPSFRERLVNMVKALTGSPMVKDNSGGAEMYGGDPREFGDFEDFHPYCDTPFYPTVLDSLLNGPRPDRPILLGEYNDIDTYRDYERIEKLKPYWSSEDPNLNDVGVRWQHDLPGIMSRADYLRGEDARLQREASLSQARFIRKFVTESVRSRSDIAGYVVTGWIDTPISTAGLLDEFGGEKPIGAENWNREDCVFLIPSRRPPWIAGGNRPGWQDTANYFEGKPIALQVGVNSGSLEGELSWSVETASGDILTSGSLTVQELESFQPILIERIYAPSPTVGEYNFVARWNGEESRWPITVWPKFDLKAISAARIFDQVSRFGVAPRQEGEYFMAIDLDASARFAISEGLSGLVFLSNAATTPKPFWREATYRVVESRPWTKRLEQCAWHQILPISGDGVIDLDSLRRELACDFEFRSIIDRIDVRTNEVHCIAGELKTEKGRVLFTTLRPYGGLGIQPHPLRNNPAGWGLLLEMIADLSANSY